MSPGICYDIDTLYYTVLYYTVLYCTILHYTVLCTILIIVVYVYLYICSDLNHVIDVILIYHFDTILLLLRSIESLWL